MTLIESLTEKINQLSAAEQAQVADFIETLWRKRSAQKPTDKPESALADPAYDPAFEEFKRASREMWRKERENPPE